MHFALPRRRRRLARLPLPCTPPAAPLPPCQVAASILRGEGFTYTLPNRSKGNQLYVPGACCWLHCWLNVAGLHGLGRAQLSQLCGR